MIRCEKCILPENYPKINFDEKGICNFCRDYEERATTIGEEELKQILYEKRNTGKYDVVVPLSGGKDSVFILYYTVKRLNLKAIAVNYNNGFQIDMANENIANACQILDVPLVEIKAKPVLQKLVLKLSLIISKIRGQRFYTCGNCNTFLRFAPVYVARKNKVPFIFWGGTSIESNNPIEGKKDHGKLNKMIKKQIKKFKSFKQIVIFFKLLPFVFMLAVSSSIERFIMSVPFKYAIRPFRVFPFVKNPKFINFYDYIQWNTVEETKLLKDELKWQHPIDRKSRFDCSLHCFGNYESLRLNNISNDGEGFCRFIREGKMDRKEALQLEQNIAGAVIDECNEIYKILNMKEQIKIW